MAISNGFDTDLVLGKLTGRLTFSSGTPISGRFFEDFHPLVSKRLLQSVVDPYYIEGTVDTNGDPANFVDFMAQLEKSVIMRALNGVFNETQQIESTLIFDRQLRNDILTQNFGKFCGYRIFVAPGEFAAKISRASFLFNGAATFNLFCFHDTRIPSLYLKSVTTVANQETIVELDDWVLNYINTNNQGGVFYIGYFQNHLGSVQALDQFVNRWNRSLAFGYTAFESAASGTNNFIRIQVPYTYRTYGMNLEIQTYKDFTNRIIKNASLFDELIGLTMALSVLEYQAYSTRSNKEERITKEMAAKIYDEINNLGTGELNPWVAGLKKQIQRETRRVNDNFCGKLGLVVTRPPVWGTESLQGVFP